MLFGLPSTRSKPKSTDESQMNRCRFFRSSYGRTKEINALFSRQNVCSPRCGFSSLKQSRKNFNCEYAKGAANIFSLGRAGRNVPMLRRVVMHAANASAERNSLL